eukprot:m.100363 g.100363  ORF g.100363 m.100363 type:complete len:454 (+) comp8749_c0_seq6:14-1375(+)
MVARALVRPLGQARIAAHVRWASGTPRLVRGTHDELPADLARSNAVRTHFLDTCVLYGYQEMSTPVLEYSELFSRSLGAESDVVSKEMYTFTDIDGSSVTLRPEGTAGTLRAVLSSPAAMPLPARVAYAGPMFRRERPQKGRYRQFHQVGIECLGIPAVSADVEAIALAAHFLARLGLAPVATLELNSIHDAATRARHAQALIAHFQQPAIFSKLSADSRARLQRGAVLRILDSKDDGDREAAAAAPPLDQFASTESIARFSDLRERLSGLGIAHVVNPRLVRGLDYYTHTVWEFVTTTLGAQAALLAGGRYDGLAETLGYRAIPGIGWAAGVERLVLAMQAAGAPPPLRAQSVFVVEGPGLPSGPGSPALALVQSLRHADIAARALPDASMSKQLRQASALGCAAAVILGGDELAAHAVTLRDLATGAPPPLFVTMRNYRVIETISSVIGIS